MLASRNARCAALAAVVHLFAASPGLTQGTAPPAISRTVLAVGRVASVVDAPMYFKLSRTALPVGASASYRGANSTIYVLSGAVTLTTADDKRALQAGEGAYIAAGVAATLQAGGGDQSVLLQYQLVSAADLDKPAFSAPAAVTELHRMAIPAIALKPGPYEFGMIRATGRAGAPRVPPHMRSGAALYYVLAEGAITIWPSAPGGVITGEGRTQPRAAGTIQEEPYGFVHAWASPPDAAMVLLQANISQEGIPEIIFVK